MKEFLKDFSKSQLNSVEQRHAGNWPIYTDYAKKKLGEEEQRKICITRSGLDAAEVLWYAPLREPALLLEFAELFRRWVPDWKATYKVLDWVKRRGVLGANYALSRTERRRRAWSALSEPEWAELEVFRVRQGPYYMFLEEDVAHPAVDQIQWVDEFVVHSVVANRCFRMIAAVKAPGGPDVKRLRELGVSGITPAELARNAQWLADFTIDTYLRRETFTCRYRLGDGTSVRGSGFHSLLGAMYLQMANFRDAPKDLITFCKWCGEVVKFEPREPPPSEAPRGTRGKHTTHKNREFCKEKHGVKDYCKNKFNYQRRKKASEGS